MARSTLARQLRVSWRYAAGEITIIVVGILIALAVDNWNEARNTGRRETDYLMRVVADLRRDTAMLAFTDSLLDRKEEALLPRVEEFVLDRPTDARQATDMTRRVLDSELKQHVTAERNFARFLRTQIAALRSTALQLLEAIDSNQ